MGTNFYASRITTESEHKQMEDLLVHKQYKDLQSMLNTINQRYHIGKRSYGWQFHFQAYNPDKYAEYEPEAMVPWGDDPEAMWEYLKRDDVIIQDEYGEAYTFNRFYDEIKPCLYADEKHINTITYYNLPDHKDEKRYDNNSEFEKEGLRFDYRWFS